MKVEESLDWRLKVLVVCKESNMDVSPHHSKMSTPVEGVPTPPPPTRKKPKALPLKILYTERVNHSLSLSLSKFMLCWWHCFHMYQLTYLSQSNHRSVDRKPYVCIHYPHNITQIHNNVLWDWQYSMKYSLRWNICWEYSIDYL